jgi:UDP-glucose 4-epimerase
VRDYIHPSDLATAHISALRLLQASGGKAEVFNLGNGEGSTVKVCHYVFQPLVELYGGCMVVLKVS